MTKHIDIRYHFVREGVQNGANIFKYVATNVMIADILTKLLPKHHFAGEASHRTRNEKGQISNVKNGTVVLVKNEHLTVAILNFNVCTLLLRNI